MFVTTQLLKISIFRANSRGSRPSYKWKCLSLDVLGQDIGDKFRKWKIFGFSTEWLTAEFWKILSTAASICLFGILATCLNHFRNSFESSQFSNILGCSVTCEVTHFHFLEIIILFRFICDEERLCLNVKKFTDISSKIAGLKIVIHIGALKMFHPKFNTANIQRRSILVLYQLRNCWYSDWLEFVDPGK